MKRMLKITLPFVVIAVGGAIALAMVKMRPAVETRPPESPPPLVRTLQVATEEVRFSVETQGTVAPRTESALVPEVAGRIVSASSDFEAGGFFDKGEVLLQIDPRDYELALAQARSRVAEAQLQLEQEETEADVARREWENLGRGEPTDLVLRKPQMDRARATLAAARADLERAKINLDRTKIRASFDGRVRVKSVDVGQYVTPGTPVARIYSVDYAEVRLPIPDADLAYLDIPLDYRGESAGGEGPEVILRAEFAGRVHEWKGRIVRTEGELDPQSRMVHVVARVKDPYARGDRPDRPPLAVGMFVRAEILGRMEGDVIVLPRRAMRGADRVLVVDDEDRLHYREVEVVKADRETVVIRSGLSTGERVCLSPLDAVVDGMKIRRVES